MILFRKPFIGYGIYLGKGAVITGQLTCIGRWGFLKVPVIDSQRAG